MQKKIQGPVVTSKIKLKLYGDDIPRVQMIGMLFSEGVSRPTGERDVAGAE